MLNKKPTYKGKQISEEQIKEVYRCCSTITEAAKYLGVCYITYVRYAKKYGLIIKGKRKKTRQLLESEIKAVQEVAINCTDAAKKLGVCFETYKKYSTMYGLYADFAKKKRVNRKRTTFPSKIKMEELLDNKHPNYPIAYFRERLFRSNLKNRECEICGYNERRVTDGMSPLLICFMDGNKHNWNLSNIKIICYNCSFITDRTGKLRSTIKKPWYDRLRWEGNGDKWSNYVLNIESGSIAKGEGKDVDITNIDSISDDELEQLKSEVKNEIN